MSGFNHLEVTIGKSKIVITILILILMVALLSISLTSLFSGMICIFLVLLFCCYGFIAYRSYLNSYLGARLTWFPDADVIYLTDLQGGIHRFTMIKRMSVHYIWIYVVLVNEEEQVNLLLPIDCMSSSEFRRLSVICRYTK
ncbi:hypothetical protein DN062_10315 [Nitrincola tibetensis]|uniref:Uncharacterized protein n=1 Tax=Nitrincola tibetensis TaxID=2219697 RepID=A0A364NL36_9GAMM|nr:hypothetical protein DN062_10315 [Nitrincola tibetensis]